MNNCNELTNNRILVIDDNPSIHDDIRKILAGKAEPNAALADAKALLFDQAPVSSARTLFDIDSAFQGEEGLAKVQQATESGSPYAMAFVDVRMPPGWDGVETITRIWRDYPELQVVICTAYSDYSWEQMIGQLGKTDSMVILKKPFDNVEVLQLAHALTEKWRLSRQVRCRLDNLDHLVSERTTELEAANEKLKAEIAERMLMEQALRLSEERFSKAFKASPIPLAFQSLRDEKFIDANQGFEELTGFATEDLIGHTPQDLKLWADPDGSKLIFTRLREQMSIRNLACRLRAKSTQLRDILLSVELFELEGEPNLLIIAQDITEQIRLENQLLQAQKMEAVGQLAAGVAHDFNNILTIVQGHASLLLAKLGADSPNHRPLQAISAAADRATKLVRQLLTFSRKQFIQLRPIDPRASISAFAEMLPRLLGEHISVEVVAASDLPTIQADAGMIEQMLMNFAVNARDAMPEGGKLQVRADAVQLGAEQARQNHEARPGHFVCFSVRDSGCGIPPEVLPRIFEPFFTTKPVGKGTGLGLATVYGIAKQHQGWVEVHSQVGQGTTFRVFIPTCATPSKAANPPIHSQSANGGHETIMVVEDEDPVRDFVVQVLKSKGYEVLAAASGLDALDQWSRRKHDIALLVTDMIMPGGLMGRELAERLRGEAPGLRVIYTSGYSPGIAGKDLTLLEGQNFLAKPYRPARLLQAVRDCLDRPAEVAGRDGSALAAAV